MRTQSGEYIPADPHDTNIEISPETQQLIDDMHKSSSRLDQPLPWR
jgi:hypothetical protein